MKKFGFKGKHKIQDRWENHIYEVLESCHSSPLVFRVRKEDGTGKIRILHRNLLLPLRTRILEEDTTPLLPEPENSNQSAEPVESIQDDPEDLPEDEDDSQSISEDDEPSVSTRPWTRVLHQHWLAPHPFPNVVLTPHPPCYLNRMLYQVVTLVGW